MRLLLMFLLIIIMLIFYVCELFNLCGGKRKNGHYCFLIELIGWEALALEVSISIGIKGLLRVAD